MSRIQDVIRTGGDTNPEIFTAGNGAGLLQSQGLRGPVNEELLRYDDCCYNRVYHGTKLPTSLVFVNGSRAAATRWTIAHDGTEFGTSTIPGGQVWAETVSIGTKLHTATNWNLSDAYYVNNWPGTPYTTHKGNGDANYPYVTQVNYITGYICAASLH